MEHPNATSNDYSTHLINKDVFYQICTSFLNNEEQNKAQMASLGQELNNLRIELKEHRVNAVEGNQKPIDPNQKGRQNATRFCGFCRTNGYISSFFRKRWETRKSRSCKMKPQPRKKLGSPKITTKDVDPPTDLGNGLDGTMIMGLWCQPPATFYYKKLRAKQSDFQQLQTEKTFRATRLPE